MIHYKKPRDDFSLTTRTVCVYGCMRIRMFLCMSDFNNYICDQTYVYAHDASEMRMKYKEGGLTGGAVVLDELFRVCMCVCF